MSDLVKIKVNIKQHVLKSDVDDFGLFKERFEERNKNIDHWKEVYDK